MKEKTVQIMAVLIIFVTLVAGGVLLVTADREMVGSNMITAAVSFITGAGVMIISDRQVEQRRKAESLLPPFGKPDRKNGER